MTKLSNTTFVLLEKGSKQGLAVGSSQDIQQTLRVGAFPNAWARQATLLEQQSCLTLLEYFELRHSDLMEQQGVLLGWGDEPLDDVNTPEPGEHTINGHDLNDLMDEHERFLGIDAPSPYGEQSAIEQEGGLVEGERKWDGDEQAEATLLAHEAEYDRRFNATYWGRLRTQVRGQTKAMIARVKALANLSAGPDQI